MYVVGVKFKDNSKKYDFSSEEQYKIGTNVLVETEKGRQLGVVTSIDKNTYNKELKEIVSVATEDDYNKFLKNAKDAKNALIETKRIVKEMNINMSLISASYSFDKKVLLFNFVSDERVDFRELVKRLASLYHTRIELHQIGVRDKAREVGGLGLCGRELCCKGVLKEVSPVNINMVKNQNIALNPTKINGACGRLLCCFNYENGIYEENRKVLPKIGEKVTYKGKTVPVVDLDIINKKYKVKMSDTVTEEVDLNDSSK